MERKGFSRNGQFMEGGREVGNGKGTGAVARGKMSQGGMLRQPGLSKYPRVFKVVLSEIKLPDCL